MEQKQAKEIEQLKKDLEEAKKETLIAYADRQTSIRIAKEDVRKAKVTSFMNNNITIKFLICVYSFEFRNTESKSLLSACLM